MLSIVPVILWAGSLSLVAIFDAPARSRLVPVLAAGAPGVRDPAIASIAEVNRTPFDLPEAESEIIAGYHTEYSGMRFGLFFLAEYLSSSAISCLATVLFLGGGRAAVPDFPLSAFEAGRDDLAVLANAILIAVFFAQGGPVRLPDVLGPGHAAPDAGRPADELRLEVWSR